MRTEPVKCPARAVIAWHVHVMTLNLLTSRKSPLILLFDKPGLLCSLVSDYRWIAPLYGSSLPSAQMPNSSLYCNTVTSIRIFCKDLRETLKYVGKFSELKLNDEIQKEHTRISLSLSLSTCRSANAFWFSRKDVHAPVSLSLFLYLQLQRRFGSRSDPYGTQERTFRKLKKLCIILKVRNVSYKSRCAR